MGYPIVVTEPTGEGMETIVESIANIDTDGIITALEEIRDAIGGSTGGVTVTVEDGVATGFTVSAVIPDGVTSIGENAFSDFSELTQIEIPGSVTTIDDYSFNGCSGLTQIVIPDSVTSIGTTAFGGCSRLTQIVIPDSVTSIGTAAFDDCSALTQIYIPDSVTSIGEYAFYGIDANAVINCGFAEGAVANAPWDAPNTVTINYGVTPNN